MLEDREVVEDIGMRESVLPRRIETGCGFGF
jgi:hypothetical protein